MTERGRYIALWNFVLMMELQNGSAFLRAQPGGQLFVVLGANNEAIQISRAAARWHSYFHTTYGFTEREKPAGFCFDALKHYIIEHGQQIELRRFAAYDLVSKTNYLSRYDGRLWKVSGADEIETVPNGEDGVFFADDDNGLPVEAEVGNHGELIERLTTINFAPQGLSGITPDQQRMAFTAWMFMLAFPDLMPTKPLLLLEGAQGSGKTSAVQLLQLALMGKRDMMVMRRNKEDDFGVVLLRSPIAIFDNLDSFIDWIPDAVCAYATGGSWTNRRLYTDDESMTIRPQAFIAIASKNPASFRREDVADRCIILRLERRAAFGQLRTLQTAILADRPRLFGEYLWYVGRIIDELRAGIADPEETYRMADFAGFVRVVGRVLEWEPEAIADMLLALEQERDAFINEEDPLVDVIHRWISYKARVGPSNVGRTLTIFELHAELETIAQANGIPWKHSTRTLLQKVRSPHVEREFHIEPLNLKGHKAFRIWRLTDPRLDIVSPSVSGSPLS